MCLWQEEEVFDILGLAHRFVFTELEAAVCDYLRTKLSMRNVCAIYDLANVYSLQSLSCVCKEFMDRNASSILASPAFISLSGVGHCLETGVPCRLLLSPGCMSIVVCVVWKEDYVVVGFA